MDCHARKAVAALLGALTLLCGLATSAWAQGGADSLRIGFVNVKEIFSGYKAAQQFEADLKAEREAAQKKIEAIEKQMSELMTEIKILEEGSALRAEVEAYARENGYLLILKIEAPRLEEDASESANRRVNMRAVLWGATDMDLTKAILDRLNAK